MVDGAAGLAYVASGEFGISVVDVKDPRQPVAIGGARPPFYAEHIAVSGSLGIASGGQAGAKIVDLADLTAPEVIGSLSGTIGRVAMNGQFAYMLLVVPGNPARTDLAVVDLREPTSPRITGQTTIGGSASDIALAGTLVYVTTGTQLQVFNVADPSRPQKIGSVDVGNSAQSVALSGSYAYVGGSSLVSVVRVENPSQPSVVGSIGVPATSLAVAGGRVYAVSATVLRIIDVTVPNLPLLLGSGESYSALDVAVYGTLVYLASPVIDIQKNKGGLYTVDASVPTLPVKLANLHGLSDNQDVAADGLFGLSAGNGAGAKVVDISDPVSPWGFGVISGTIRRVAVAGDYAYAIALISGNPARTDLLVIDPYVPEVIGSINVGYTGSAVVISGTRAYVTTASELRIISIQNPRAPQLLSTVAVGDTALAVALAGQYAYVGSSSSLSVVDVERATKVGGLGTGASALAVQSGRLYAISGLDFKIIDVQQPTAPVLLSTQSSLSAQDIAVSGTTAILARPASSHLEGTGGLWFYDVADPVRPALLGRLVMPGATRSVMVANGLVYAGDSAGTIDVVDLNQDCPSASPSPTFTPTPNLLATPTKTNGATTISGRVRYYNGDRSVDGAVVTLTGPTTETTTSETTGNYTCPAGVGNSWEVEAAKNGGANSAVSSLDASYVLQYVVGKRALDENQQLACDASGNGGLSSLDASKILQFVVGKLDRLPVAETCQSDWVFRPDPAWAANQTMVDPQMTTGQCTPGTISYDPLMAQASNQDFLGILFGDCTGNWQPAGSGSGAAFAAARGSRTLLRIGRLRRSRAGRVRVPIYVRSVEPFHALDAELEYDPKRLRPVRVAPRRRATESIASLGTNDSGQLKVALASATPLSGEGGPLLTVVFELLHPDASEDRVIPLLGSIDDEAVTRLR